MTFAETRANKTSHGPLFTLPVFSFAPTITVLDCGASRVALGHFAGGKDRAPRLEAFAWEPLSSENVAASAGWLQATAAAIARLGERVPMRGPVTLVLPGHLVLTKLINVPRVSAAKREKIVRFEAQQNIPHALHELVWDYAVVGEAGTSAQVMLCAARIEVIDALCAAAVAAGFAPRVVLPSVVAFRAAVASCAGREPTLFVNLGSRTATFLLEGNGRTDVRAAAFASGAPEVSSATVDALAKRLALEITRTLGHFERVSGAAKPTRIVLAGGASRAACLAEALAADLKTPTQLAGPLVEIEMAPAAASAGAPERAAHLADLVGAARLSLGGATAPLNLLPPDLRAAEAARRRRPWVAAAVVLFAATLVLPLEYFRTLETALRSKAAAIEAEIAPLRERAARNHANLRKLATLQNQLAAAHGISARRTAWSDLFADLEERFVKLEDIWIDRLRPALAETDGAPRFAVSGRMLDRTNPRASISPDAHRRVTELLATVAASPFVAAVQAEHFDNGESGVMHFELVLVASPSRSL